MSLVNDVVAKPLTLTQLAAIYSVSAPTLKKWLRQFAPHIGPRRGRFYTPNQVLRIFAALGHPGYHLFAD